MIRSRRAPGFRRPRVKGATWWRDRWGRRSGRCGRRAPRRLGRAGRRGRARGRPPAPAPPRRDRARHPIGRIRWPRLRPSSRGPGTTGGRPTCSTAWSTPSCAPRARNGPTRSRRSPAPCGCATSARGPTTTTTTSPGSASRCSAPGPWRGARPARRWARSRCSCATGGARTAAAGSGGGAATTSRTPPPTARRRSCSPAGATSGWRRRSPTGCTTPCWTRRPA